MLKVSDLSVRRGNTMILSDISFSAQKGTITALLGASGAGKSTLLAALCGQLKPYKGTVVLENSGCAGYVPQTPYSEDCPLNISQIVTLSDSRTWLSTPPEARYKAMKVLGRLGLQDYSNYRLSELSGGQKQRVAIGAAIYLGSEVILCDEPTSKIDPGLASEVLGLLKSLANEGSCIVISTHDPLRVMQYADRAIGLRSGRLVLDDLCSNISQSAVDDLYRMV